MTRRPRIGSLRGRLLAAAIALLAAGLIVADVTAYLSLSRQLHERSERFLDRAFVQLDKAAAGPEVILASDWAQVLLLPSTAVVGWDPQGRQFISTLPAGVPVDDRGVRLVASAVDGIGSAGGDASGRLTPGAGAAGRPRRAQDGRAGSRPPLEVP